MAATRGDEEQLLKLIERVRLLLAVDEEIPARIKLEVEPTLRMLEAAVPGAHGGDPRLAADYYRRVYAALSPYADLEALLSAMRVFAPYL